MILKICLECFGVQDYLKHIYELGIEALVWKKLVVGSRLQEREGPISQVLYVYICRLICLCTVIPLKSESNVVRPRCSSISILSNVMKS